MSTLKTIWAAVLILITCLTHAQPWPLISQGGVNVTYNARKIASEKKRDRWSIAVNVTVPASGIYYVEHLTGVTATDIFLDEYLTVTVPNRSNRLIPMEKGMTASHANFITSDNGLVFEITNGPGLAFDVSVPTDQVPDVKASFKRNFFSLNELNVIRASEQDQFAAAFPQSRMFITYSATDTLLPKRNRMLHYMNANRQSETVTYSNEQFLVQSASGEKVTKQIDYLDWDDKKSNARIVDNDFEISRSGNFDDTMRVPELLCKDEQGNKRRVVLEKIAKHLLLPGEKLLPDQLRISANGKYTLKMQTDGNLVLYDQDSQALWATNTNGHLVFMADMQRNGNFLLTTIGPPAWQSKTKEEGSYLSVTDYGNLILYRPDGLGIWQSNPGR